MTADAVEVDCRNAAQRIARPALTETMRVRCDQNVIFGCGRVNALPVTRVPLTPERVTLLATGRCTCGLPLALSRAAN